MNAKPLFGLLLFCLASTALAETPRPRYQPLGAPADPAVSARWNFYRDYAQATGLLKQIAAAHPEICRLQSLGKSYGDREMWVLTITNQTAGETEKEATKPAFWIDGGIHANEIQAVDVVLYTAWYLTEMYGRNQQVTKLVDQRVFYLMPMMSPDSRDAHMYAPNTTHAPRGGLRPVDDDRDGKFDEDPADDLDGDGSITQMRIRDPLGRYKPHQDYPDMLVPADHDETGEYTLLGAEGIDDDGDGRVNEDGPGYYDPNRDWPWQWEPAYVQRGAYRYPLSVPENRMVADFVMAHTNIAGAQSYHNTGGMILRGPGAKNDTWPRADIQVYDRLGKRGEQMLPGYKYMNTAEELYEVWGGETDWFHTMVGAFAFVNELNTPFNLFRKQDDGGHFFASNDDQRKFDEWLLMGDGFTPWREIDHPQYGKVEVGGVKKNWGRQPPSFLLEEECHRNMAFTLWHADQMPLVEIESTKVEKLNDDLYQVTATLMNRKLTPTRSAFNIQHNVTPADRVEIAGANNVVAAMTSESPLFDTPEQVERMPHSVRLDSIQPYRPVYVRWLVQGSGPYQLKVNSVKGGTATRKTTEEPTNSPSE